MRVVGPYLLARKLGAGGMGEVWMARRDGVGGAAKNVAIKMLRADRASDEAAKKMFLDEARLTMMMSNSNIVQVFDVGELEDGACYMAMEWVDGLDLAQLSACLAETDELLSPTLTAFIMGEVLKALSYAHELEIEGRQRTIVHRDVSPHNVMLSVTGEVKLMDFGIARLASEETSGVHVKGKLRYMPPEQLRGESREPTIDLFAVGAMLHELLEGKKFRAGVVDEARLFGMIIDGEVPKLSDADAFPPELVQVCWGLLQPQVEDRIPSAREAYRELTRWDGYRDGKFELEELVRRHKPPQAELSDEELVAARFADATGTLTDGSSTDVGRRAQGEQTGERLGPNAVPPTAILPRDPTGTHPTREPQTPNRKPLVLGLLFGLVGLGLALVSTGAMLGWWTPQNPTPEPDQAQVAERSEAPPRDPISPAPEAPSPEAPTPGSPPPAAPPPEPPTSSGDPDLPTSTGPSRATQPRAQIVKTSVTVVAPSYRYWLQIRIAGKAHTIDRMEKKTKISLKLKPGNYPVSYREDVTASWRPAGSVSIPSGKKVNLEFTAGTIKPK